MTAGDLYHLVRRRLTAAGITDAQLEADELCKKFLGVSRTELLLSDFEVEDVFEGTDRELPVLVREKAYGALSKIPCTAFPERAARPVDGEGLVHALERRLAGEPLQYILGEWDFMGFRTLVRPGVLIPRGDSELLARTAVEKIKKRRESVFLELCCGSGAVGLAVARLTGARPTLTDISEEALALTRDNAALYGIEAEILKKDASYDFDFQKKFPLAIANPPYIAYSEKLEDEVALYEPSLALYAPEEGLYFYRQITAHADAFLSSGGLLLFEIGERQGAAVTALMERQFQEVTVLQDYGGHDRVVCGKFRG